MTISRGDLGRTQGERGARKEGGGMPEEGVLMSCEAQIQPRKSVLDNIQITRGSHAATRARSFNESIRATTYNNNNNDSNNDSIRDTTRNLT